MKKIVIHLHNKGVISGDEMADVQRYQTCDANKVVYKAMCGDCGKGKLMLLAEALKEEASHTNNQRIAGHITDFLKQYGKLCTFNKMSYYRYRVTELIYLRMSQFLTLE